MDKKDLRVVCAVLHSEGKYLMLQRPTQAVHGGLWEFPGGKVNMGESDEDALYREISEELGVEISILRDLPHVFHEYPTFRIRLIPFLCEIKAGSLEMRAHQDYIWQDKEGLSDLAISDADVKVLMNLS